MALTIKKYLLFILSILLGLMIKAQEINQKLNIGFFAAMNINRFTTDEFATSNGFDNYFRTSGMIGLSFQKQRAKKSSYLLEVLFTSKGGSIRKINDDLIVAVTPISPKQDDVYDQLNYRIDYIELPFIYQFHINKYTDNRSEVQSPNIQFGLGLAPSIKLKSSINYNEFKKRYPNKLHSGYEEVYHNRVNNDARLFNLSAVANMVVNVRYFRRSSFQLITRFNQSLFSPYKNDSGITENISTFSIGLGMLY